LPVDYVIRPICVEDAGRERDFICGLSAASRYHRLMYAVREPSQEFIERMVQVDRVHAMAFVAVVGDGVAQRIIGVARYASAPGSAGSEFAIAVADPWQSRGVGTAIALRLIEHAREQGIHHLDARILATNSRMLGLAHGLGFIVDSNRDEFSVLDARLDLSTNQDAECKSRSIPTTTSTATSRRLPQYAPR
jgi:RimJ/RimL family protein N-acetyltransferase